MIVTTSVPEKDFPPLTRERPREDNVNQHNRESPREGNGSDPRDREIESLRRKIDTLERSRKGEQVTSLYTSDNTDDSSKNGEQAQQGPSKTHPNQLDMQAYIKEAMETLCGFAEQLNLQTGSTRTHLDK